MDLSILPSAAMVDAVELGPDYFAEVDLVLHLLCHVTIVETAFEEIQEEYAKKNKEQEGHDGHIEDAW